MASIYSEDFKTHTVDLRLGPRRGRIQPGDVPEFYIFDAAMVDMSYKLFPKERTEEKFKELMGLAIPTTTPRIFLTTPMEIMVTDDWKENEKKVAAATGEEVKTTNLKFWCHAGEGRGIVSSYPNLPSDTYGHIYPVLSQVSLFSIQCSCRS
jgi:hypothetical protein